MPLLSEEDLEKLRKVPMKLCDECGAETHKNYCRTCDVFFREGHEEDCSSYESDHKGHRVY